MRFPVPETADGERQSRRPATLLTQSYSVRPQRWNELGRPHSFSKDWPEALEAFRKAHEVAQDDLLVMRNLLRCAEEMGDLAGAAAWPWAEVASARAAAGASPRSPLTLTLFPEGMP